MQLHGTISFDADEEAVFTRALAGHEGAIVREARSRKEADYRPVRAFLGRIRQGALQGDDETRRPGEVLGLEALQEFDEVMRELIALYQPETATAYWREIGAPGAADAVEGLALERRETVRQIGECRVLVALAINLIERMEAAAGRTGREGVGAVMAG